MPVPSRIFGWHRQPQDDGRDHKFHLVFPGRVALPQHAQAHSGPVTDQGQEGSCVWHGIPSAMVSVFVALGIPLAFINGRYYASQEGYYQYRMVYGDVNSDDGCEIRVAMKCAAKYGICQEKLWPYKAMANFATRPSAEAFANAQNHKIATYIALTGNADTLLTSMMTCIADGYPFVFGVNCTKAWNSDRGVIPQYVPGEGFDGGHCVICNEYDQPSKTFFGQNSWGTDWGLQPKGRDTRGYFSITFADMSNPTVTSDFWTIRMTSDYVPPAPPVPPAPTPTPIPPPAPVIPDVKVGVRNNVIQVIK